MNDKVSSVENDKFAQIAAQNRSVWSSQLVQPTPARLAAKTLPDMKPCDVPVPAAWGISRSDQVSRELDSLRKQYAKFLVNHAPKVKPLRETVPLPDFAWRLETADDRRNFAGVLGGNGEWVQVAIPHYGPPEGRATAYYRKVFTVTREMLAKGAVFARFQAVDYKAHVFANGSYVGSHEGFFAAFEFECSAHLHIGENVLVVRVDNDAIMMGNSSWDVPSAKTAGDKIYAATGPGYDDPEVGWHHCPPGMGIYQPVSIEARARLHVSDMFVRPLPASSGAEIWLEVFNCDTSAKRVSVLVSIYGRNFKQVVIKNSIWHPRTIRVPGLSDMDKPEDNQIVELAVGAGVNYFKIPVELPGFRWWSPEEPWLYQAQVKVLDHEGDEVDAAERQFGMRTFEIDETTDPKGTIRLNSREIRLRGANTMGFEQLAVMRGDWDTLRDDILLAKLAHMNFLRLTQRPVQQEVYDWCDRLGMMTQTDLPLFGCLRRNQFVEAIRQAAEMERHVRAHPCNILVSYINEPFPNADGNPGRHLTRPELLEFFKAADVVVRQMNPDRVIKPVDGDYDPPAPGLPDIHCYNGWYLSNGVGLGELHKGFWQKVKPGWNYACGEFGAEGLEDEVTMRRYYPADWLPSKGSDESSWSPAKIRKAQTAAFHYMWFERPDSLSGWIGRSQAHHAWVTKLMTEAFRRNPRMVSCAIHHYIDAFPAGWMKSVVDVDRRPKPAYFAYRDALTPLMVAPRSDRSAFFGGERVMFEAWICNDRAEVPAAASLGYSLIRGERVIATGKAPVRVPSLSSAVAGMIPIQIPDDVSDGVLTLRVSLLDDQRRVVHENDSMLRVFERPKIIDHGPVAVIGPRDGNADRLARDLGLKRGRKAEIILVDGFDSLPAAERERITRAVEAGAHAVLMNLEPGDHKVAGEIVRVQRCAMGPRHFVSRVPGHSISGDFQPDDFRFWFDRDIDRPSPILDSVFEGRAWDPVLTSGNPGPGGTWIGFLAVGTKSWGRGRWTISQLSLSSRISGNPVAEIFARRLIAAANYL